MSSSQLAVVLAAMLMGAGSASGADSAYPSKPIRLVVPFAPGGGADIMGRAIAQRINAGVRQPVIVENRAGAGGWIGAEFVAKSAPDGYTLLLGTTSTLVWAPALFEKLAYDSVNGFAPIAPIASAFTVLVVHPSVPAKSVKELIALARAHPGALDYASSGVGAPAHLAAELFNYQARVKTTHVPYKGSAPGMLALISGETDLMFSNVLPALGPLKSGRMRALAVTTLKRSPVLPNVPTVAESGLPGFEVYVFYGIVAPVAPAGAPKEAVERLHAVVTRSLDGPEVIARLAASGADPMRTRSPHEFSQLIRAEWDKWSNVARAAGLRGTEG